MLCEQNLWHQIKKGFILLSSDDSDEVALAARACVVVLLEVGARERRRADLVERRLAVLFERLAEHLRRQLRAHLLQAFDRVVAVLDLRLVLVLERLLGELLLEDAALELPGQLVALLLDLTDGLPDRELPGGRRGLELRA